MFYWRGETCLSTSVKGDSWPKPSPQCKLVPTVAANCQESTQNFRPIKGQYLTLVHAADQVWAEFVPMTSQARSSVASQPTPSTFIYANPLRFFLKLPLIPKHAEAVLATTMKYSAAVALLSALVAPAAALSWDKQSILGGDDLTIPGDSPLQLCDKDHDNDILTIEEIILTPNPPQAYVCLGYPE